MKFCIRGPCISKLFDIMVFIVLSFVIMMFWAAPAYASHGETHDLVMPAEAMAWSQNQQAWATAFERSVAFDKYTVELSDVIINLNNKTIIRSSMELPTGSTGYGYRGFSWRSRDQGQLKADHSHTSAY